MERFEKIVHAILRLSLVDQGGEGARLLQPTGYREAMDSDPQSMDVRVGSRGGLDAPIGGLFEPANQSHCTDTEHAEHEWVERTEAARVVGRFDRSLWVTLLAVDEGQRIMAQREVRTQIHSLLELDERLVLAVTQP
jgi:hypothetical protein